MKEVIARLKEHQSTTPPEHLYSPRRTGDGITLKYQATHPIGCAA